jgi:hypothetical protein
MKLNPGANIISAKWNLFEHVNYRINKRVSVTSLFYGDEVQLLFSTRRNSLLWN